MVQSHAAGVGKAANTVAAASATSGTPLTPPPQPIMADITPTVRELSGLMVVIIIAGGVLLAIVLFIFAKRQIMRFTIRSRRGPHAPVGYDAKKSIKREIERRLDCIPRIVHEPQLIWDDDERYIVQPQPDRALPPFYWRLKAVDDIKLLEREIAKQDGSVRQPRDSIRAFLLTTLAVAMNGGSGQRLIQQFCDMYEHARHDPSCFGRDEYEAYRRLLLKLHDAAKMIKAFGLNRKSSPSRTPQKKHSTKNQSLLDPSRLRPPPMLSPSSIGSSIGGSANDLVASNNRLNITLGLQQQHQQQQHHTGNAQEENEILSISFSGTGDSSIV